MAPAIPVVREIAWREPAAAFAPLADEPFAMLLGGSDGPRARFAYIAAAPFDTVALSAYAPAAADPFAALRERLRRYPVAGAAPVPFVGGAVGVVGYEVGHALERLPPRKTPVFPLDLAFGFYDVIAAFDLNRRRAWTIASGWPETEPGARARRAAARADALAARLGTAPLAEPVPAPGGAWTADLSAAEYETKVARIIAYIRAGDIYQANLTQRWTAPWPAQLDAFALHRRLSALSGAPFAAYLNLGAERQILSASPERFLSVERGGRVETRPIKGTRPRGRTPEEDRALAAELQASAKDRAENLMIVDLLRNDLARVCRPGSVAVPGLCALESFATVHHLVSTVTGELRDGHTAVDLLAACFPGGSVTGAPKIRAMEIIHELEPVARGPYCGAVAWLGFDGAMDSSIVIRTLVRNGSILMAQAGGGVVADSDPAQEYAESVVKARPLLAALTGP